MEDLDIANMSDEEFQKMMMQNIEAEEKSQQSKGKVSFENAMYDDYEPIAESNDSFWGSVLNILNDQMDTFNEYMFVFSNSDTSELPNTKDLHHTHSKVVLIATSCERKNSQYQKIKNNYHHIFSQYYWDVDDYVTSVPLGYYGNDFHNLVVPMEERLYNMNFIGCLNRNRAKFASMICKIPLMPLILAKGLRNDFAVNLTTHIGQWLHPRDYFKFTPDFAKGYDQETYLNILHSSKISLCPRGWRNTETFRLNESMRAGCLTITETLPDRPYYKNIPAIQVDNWKDGLDLARYYLNQPHLLKEKGEECRKFYEENLSPKAAAKIIMDKLAEKAI